MHGDPLAEAELQKGSVAFSVPRCGAECFAGVKLSVVVIQSGGERDDCQWGRIRIELPPLVETIGESLDAIQYQLRRLGTEFVTSHQALWVATSEMNERLSTLAQAQASMTEALIKIAVQLEHGQ